jgi:hypothetical protein
MNEGAGLNVSRSLPLGALALALPVLLLWRCAHDASAPASSSDAASATKGAPASTSASPAANAAPAQSSTAAAAASNSSTPAASTAPGAPTAPPSATPTPAGSRIASAVANSDPRDLALLMRIERELKRDPPPAVHELVRQRKAGASREALLASARQLPENDLTLRVLVLRWVDEVSPAPGAAPTTKPAVPTSSSSGHSLVRPIQPVAKP